MTRLINSARRYPLSTAYLLVCLAVVLLAAVLH